jgi:hypothetical protein
MYNWWKHDEKINYYNTPIIYYWCQYNRLLGLPSDVIKIILMRYYNLRYNEISQLLKEKHKQLRNKYSLRWNLYKQPVTFRTCKQKIHDSIIDYLNTNKIYYITKSHSEYRCFRFRYDEEGITDCHNRECKYSDIIHYYEINIF